MNGMVNQLSLLAQAEGAPTGADPLAGCMEMLPFFAIIIGIFYFMVIRPQQKQQKQQQQFLDRLKEGDRVVTSSGIHGRIVAMAPGVVTIDVGDRTRIRIERAHITRYEVEADQNKGGDAPSEKSSDNTKSSGRRKRKGN